MTPDLPDDGRHRIRGELDAALELEAVDRLDQPDRADLDEVVDRFAAAGVAPREGANQRHELLHEPVTRIPVPPVARYASREVYVGAPIGHHHRPALPPTSSSSSHSRPSWRTPRDPVDEGVDDPAGRGIPSGAVFERPHSEQEPVVMDVDLEMKIRSVHGRPRRSRPRGRARRCGRPGNRDVTEAPENEGNDACARAGPPAP